MIEPEKWGAKNSKWHEMGDTPNFLQRPEDRQWLIPVMESDPLFG